MCVDGLTRVFRLSGAGREILVYKVASGGRAIGRSDFHPSWPRRSENREDRDPAATQIRKSISIHAPEQSYLDGRRFATLARSRGHDGYKGSRNAIRPFAPPRGAPAC